MQKLKLPELIQLNDYIRLERGNRYKASSAKKEQTQLVAWHCKEQRIKPYNKLTQLVFIWYHKNRRKDFDNVEFSQKFIRDGLVMAGVVPGDGWKHMPPKTEHLHQVRKKPGVEVIMEGLHI